MNVTFRNSTNDRRYEADGSQALALVVLALAGDDGCVLDELGPWGLLLAHGIPVLRSRFGLDVIARQGDSVAVRHLLVTPVLIERIDGRLPADLLREMC